MLYFDRQVVGSCANPVEVELIRGCKSYENR